MHEARDVSGIVVRDDLPWYSVISYHPVSSQLCNPFTIDLRSYRFHMKPFRKRVYPDLDGIVPIALRKWSNQIHGYDFPRTSRYLMRVHSPPYSRPLAGLTSADVILDLIAHAWPPVIPLYQLLRSVLSGMAHHRNIVMECNDLIPQLGISRNIDLFLIKD